MLLLFDRPTFDLNGNRVRFFKSLCLSLICNKVENVHQKNFSTVVKRNFKIPNSIYYFQCHCFSNAFLEKDLQNNCQGSRKGFYKRGALQNQLHIEF